MVEAMRLHSKIFLAMTLSLCMFGGVMVVSAPAYAEPPLCFVDQNCDTKWPGEQGCREDQVEMRSFDLWPLDAGRGSIFFSSACHATWAEFVFDNPSCCTFLVLQLWMQPQYGGVERILRNDKGEHYTLVEGTTNIFRTVLLSWNYSVKACLFDRYTEGKDIDIDTESTGDQNDGGCTPWV
jgi:hypothetical protein